MSAFMRRGWRSVVLHFRGCGGQPGRLPRTYHPGDTGDFAFVVATLRRREFHTPLAAVGYSLGGNALLKWLGRPDGITPLKAAVAVSVPFLLSDTVERMQHGFSRLYQWLLLRSLRNAIERKRRRVPLPLKVQDLSTLKNFRDFDENVTAPLHGFEGADHIYADASARQYLRGILIPTLLLHARDDPFMTASSVPQPEELSESVTLELSAHGGHVGFVTGNCPWCARYWLEERIPEYLARYL
jgi:hypothetical protein